MVGEGDQKLTASAAPSALREPALAQRYSLADLVLLATAIVAAAIVYGPIVGCYFFSDDFLNLYQIVNFPPLRYLLTPNGGHLLVSRNLVFWVWHALFGNEPMYYYASALLLHLVNVALLFHLLRASSGRRTLAWFGAVLWGTSPLHEGTLGWYAVFGQVMGTTTTLIILCRATALAARGRGPGRGEVALWYALALVGATAFGTGIAIAATLPVVLWLLLPRIDGRRFHLPPLAALPALLPLLYFGLMAGYASISGERALQHSPTAAMLTDVGAITTTLGRLFAHGLTGLLIGAWQPASTSGWPAVVGLSLLACACAAFFSSRRDRATLGAALLLALACYGSIALARGAFLQTYAEDVIPRLARYHYTAQVFLTVALGSVLAPLLRRARYAPTAVLTLWLAVVLGGYAMRAPAIDLHDAARAHTRQTLQAIRRTIRARPTGSDVFIPNRLFRSLPMPGEFFPGQAAIFVIFIASNTVEGRRVFFVERRPAALAAAAAGRITAELLIPPPLATEPVPSEVDAP